MIAVCAGHDSRRVGLGWSGQPRETITEFILPMDMSDHVPVTSHADTVTSSSSLSGCSLITPRLLIRSGNRQRFWTGKSDLISVSLSVAGQSVPHADYYEIAGMLSRNRIQSNGEVVS